MITRKIIHKQEIVFRKIQTHSTDMSFLQYAAQLYGRLAFPKGDILRWGRFYPKITTVKRDAGIAFATLAGLLQSFLIRWKSQVQGELFCGEIFMAGDTRQLVHLNASRGG